MATGRPRSPARPPIRIALTIFAVVWVSILVAGIFLHRLGGYWF